MFTGIIETTGRVVHIKQERTNRLFTIQSTFSRELKINQSVAHNGACLSVTDVKDDRHIVTAIAETLARTHFDNIKEGDMINLERSMLLTDRLDGHLVQGHVDATALCSKIEDKNGSKLFYFTHEKNPSFITIPKGSVCVNGVSLTVVESSDDFFSVAVIPYTLEHTNFKNIIAGAKVNVEFDLIGKYVRRIVKDIT